MRFYMNADSCPRHTLARGASLRQRYNQGKRTPTPCKGNVPACGWSEEFTSVAIFCDLEVAVLRDSRKMAGIAQEITSNQPAGLRLLARIIFAFLAAITALGIAAPFVNAARFSSSVQRALEESLGRRVTFERVYYRLFPQPGFSLENVTIGEDPHYGLEPFSYMNGLEARLRIDKLLLGKIRFANLRLIDPSLNLVKRGDGTWNVVELLERMSAPRPLLLTLFPAIEVSNGRLDFKLGNRKTTLYVTEADVSVYPERSGRVVVNFSGSPARTDRAGNGFGSMRGSFNWMVNPPSREADQFEADVTLEPSNLSELTTLIEGQDIGVHGTISSRAHIAGPLGALRVSGELRLQDVHRWDLLPSSGADWRVPYDGSINMLAHSLELRTSPQRTGEAPPAALQVKANEFLTKPAWTIMTSLNKAPVQSLLPLARRMGFAVPAGVELSGAIDGAVGYSNNGGFSGEVSLHDAVAKLPNIAPISTAAADLKIVPDGLHLESAILQATGGGTLRVGGDYSWRSQRLATAITVNDVSTETLKNTAQAWFGTPSALGALGDGNVTGELTYDSGSAPAPNPSGGWSGQLQFANATLNAAGVGIPLTHSQGHVVFTPLTVDVAHFSAMLGERAVQGNYHYNQTAKRAERVHLEFPTADFLEIAAALEPAWQDPGILARLPFTTRSIPSWLAARNLEGDITIAHFSVNQNDLGPLSAHFVWQGVNLQISSLQLRLSEGSLKAAGAVNLAAREPKASLRAALTGFRWGGGTVDAEGNLQTSGTGAEGLRNLQANGSFWGENVTLSPNDSFEKVSGAFELSFAGNAGKLHFSKMQAVQPNDDWSGEASSNSDGQLVFDLGNGDRQLHIVSALAPVQPPLASPALTSETVPYE
jgi:hypothetical protein